MSCIQVIVIVIAALSLVCYGSLSLVFDRLGVYDLLYVYTLNTIRILPQLIDVQR